MKKEGEKEFEVIFNEVISHRDLIYADNEETARYNREETATIKHKKGKRRSRCGSNNTRF